MKIPPRELLSVLGGHEVVWESDQTLEGADLQVSRRVTRLTRYAVYQNIFSSLLRKYF